MGINSAKKRTEQLGMSQGAARNILVKKLLFQFICDNGDNTCFRCKEPMCIDTFSIEHKEPWLDSEDPIGLFLNTSNISFSHLSCNCSAGKRHKLDEKGLEARRERRRKQKRQYMRQKRKENPQIWR